MDEVKCGECKWSEYDFIFRELWCKRKGAEVNDDDSCERGERQNDS